MNTFLKKTVQIRVHLSRDQVERFIHPRSIRTGLTVLRFLRMIDKVRGELSLNRHYERMNEFALRILVFVEKLFFLKSGEDRIRVVSAVVEHLLDDKLAVFLEFLGHVKIRRVFVFFHLRSECDSVASFAKHAPESEVFDFTAFFVV